MLKIGRVDKKFTQGELLMENRLSDLLQQKRKERNLTKKIAEIMGVTPMYYAGFENNKLLPTRRKLNFFASFLEMDENTLWEVIESSTRR